MSEIAIGVEGPSGGSTSCTGVRDIVDNQLALRSINFEHLERLSGTERLPPINVWEFAPGHFRGIDGFHRWGVAKNRGDTHVEVIVMHFPPAGRARRRSISSASRATSSMAFRCRARSATARSSASGNAGAAAASRAKRSITSRSSGFIRSFGPAAAPRVRPAAWLPPASRLATAMRKARSDSAPADGSRASADSLRPRVACPGCWPILTCLANCSRSAAPKWSRSFVSCAAASTH